MNVFNKETMLTTRKYVNNSIKYDLYDIKIVHEMSLEGRDNEVYRWSPPFFMVIRYIVYYEIGIWRELEFAYYYQSTKWYIAQKKSKNGGLPEEIERFKDTSLDGCLQHGELLCSEYVYIKRGQYRTSLRCIFSTYYTLV